MKTLVKTFIASVIVLAGLFTHVKASVEPSNYQTTINSFINSYKTNDYKIMKNLFSHDALYKYNRGTEMVTCTASDFLKFVKENQGIIFQNFSAKSEIISQSDAMIMAKITLYEGQYNEFAQYITLENNKGKWKITELLSVYESTSKKGELAK